MAELPEKLEFNFQINIEGQGEQTIQKVTYIRSDIVSKQMLRLFLGTRKRPSMDTRCRCVAVPRPSNDSIVNGESQEADREGEANTHAETS